MGADVDRDLQCRMYQGIGLQVNETWPQIGLNVHKMYGTLRNLQRGGCGRSMISSSVMSSGTQRLEFSPKAKSPCDH